MQEERGMREQVGNTVGSFHRLPDEGCRNGEVRASFRPVEPEVPRGHSGRTAETCKQMDTGLASSI